MLEADAENPVMDTELGGGGATTPVASTVYPTLVLILIKLELGKITMDSISSVGMTWLSMTILIWALAVPHINTNAQKYINPFNLRMFSSLGYRPKIYLML
ncbi:MAG: hypothetical protein DRQ98_12325 [Gammaproteobacteria bacterium]|nr:MAG: hypothetical protein DRQ98_12325 [Gammaproteobacteria bacterium]